MKSVSSLAAEPADREAIRHCLAQYCCGIDRRDFDLVEETFWPDATDDHDVPASRPPPPRPAHR